MLHLLNTYPHSSKDLYSNPTTFSWKEDKEALKREESIFTIGKRIYYFEDASLLLAEEHCS